VQIANEGIDNNRHHFLNAIGLVFVIDSKFDLDLNGGGDTVALKNRYSHRFHVDKNGGVFNFFFDDFPNFPFLGLEWPELEVLQKTDRGTDQKEKHG